MPWCVAVAFPGQVCMRGAAGNCSAACFQAHSNSCQARAFETSPPAYAAFEPLPFIVLSITINCFSGTFREVPGSTPSGASPF